MNEFSWTALLLAVFISIAWTVFMYRMRKGAFRIIGTTDTATFFKTSVGEFRLDKKHRRLQVRAADGGWRGYDSSDIKELSFRQSEEPAWFWEVITGFNIWDFSGRYRDQNIVFKIDVVRNDGSTISMFEASQLEEREFWIWGWWVRFVRSILESVHLIKDVDGHSRDVYGKLQDEFRQLGVGI